MEIVEVNNRTENLTLLVVALEEGNFGRDIN